MSDSAYCVQDSRWAERSSRKPADCQFVVFDTSFCVRDTRERNRRPLAGIIHKGLRYCVRGWLPEAERFDAVKSPRTLAKSPRSIKLGALTGTAYKMRLEQSRFRGDAPLFRR